MFRGGVKDQPGRKQAYRPRPLLRPPLACANVEFVIEVWVVDVHFERIDSNNGAIFLVQLSDFP